VLLGLLWVVVGFTHPFVDGERVGVWKEGGGKEATPTVRGSWTDGRYSACYEGVVCATERGDPAKAGIPVEGP
jgi:hypothetical protein